MAIHYFSVGTEWTTSVFLLSWNWAWILRSDEPSTVTVDGLSCYQDFASGFELDLKSCLLRDMKVCVFCLYDTNQVAPPHLVWSFMWQECVDCESNVFYILLPAMYKQVSTLSVCMRSLTMLSMGCLCLFWLQSILLYIHSLLRSW